MRGPFPSLTLAAVLHGHRGQLEAEEANKTAHSLGEPNNARPSKVTGVWWCTGPLKPCDTRYWMPAGGLWVCSHLGFYNLANFSRGNLCAGFNSNEVRNICVNKLEKMELYIHMGVAGCWCELIAEGKMTSIQITLENSLQLAAWLIVWLPVWGKWELSSRV